MPSASSKEIPFNSPYLSGNEEAYVLDALRKRTHCGNHQYSERCIGLLQSRYGFKSVFSTPSCTAALEMGALLASIGPGDEVVLPSYTFSSTANAIALRGARPVFCEVTPESMNMDPSHAATLIGERTRMLLPIDYAGIPCEIDAICQIAKTNGIVVMQDAAQSLHSMHEGRPCGMTADVAAFSFHETKNFSCGEGGALVVNRAEWVERAHILQEKGTDRRRVLLGLQDKYSWVDFGSSFLLSDILAAMLLAQLEAADTITALRSRVTAAYRDLLAPYEDHGCLRTPHPPDHCTLNHHAFFVIFDSGVNRATFLAELRKRNVSAYIGYVPLHSSPMGRRFGYRPEDLPVTEDLASRIVRLPLYADLAQNGLEYCVEMISEVLELIYDG